MDRNDLKTTIQNVLQKWLEFVSRDPNYRAEAITDESKNRFLLIGDGWEGWTRLYGTLFDLAVRDDKIWILEDNTERGIALDLIAAGVPKNQIVLAWQHPKKRELTEFAVA